MTFGAFIRRARTKRGLSLEKVAKALGVSLAYMSDMERGARAPLSLDRCRRVAEILSMPTATIVDQVLDQRNDWALAPMPEHVKKFVRDVIVHADQIKIGQLALARDALNLHVDHEKKTG